MQRPNGVFKKTNEYQQLIDSSFYENCPKAVFAAIAVSLLINHGITPQDAVTGALIDEWRTLNENGLVPQKAPR